MFIKILLELRPQFRIAETQLLDNPFSPLIHREPFGMGFEITFVLEGGDPGLFRSIGNIIEKSMGSRIRPADIVDSDFDFRLFPLHSRQRQQTRFSIHPGAVKEVMRYRTIEKPVRTHRTGNDFITLPAVDFRQLEILQIGNFLPVPGVIPDITAVVRQEIMHRVMDPGFASAGQQQSVSFGPDQEFTRSQFRIQFPQNDLLCILLRSAVHHGKPGSGSFIQMDFQIMRGILQIVRCVFRQHDPISGFPVFGQLKIGKQQIARQRCQYGSAV